ncbi:MULTISPECIES: hypothetical protein [unclassified Mycolicibacterium]|uniref:MmyB family transcriptional regulator n=1 Tax=unclassified Mycolicibacterium TaxID=2636767 RepID=UPI001391A0D5|nr:MULTISPECIES: hypothetical protein [unclassified Mycolicibacterium]
MCCACSGFPPARHTRSVPVRCQIWTRQGRPPDSAVPYGSVDSVDVVECRRSVSRGCGRSATAANVPDRGTRHPNTRWAARNVNAHRHGTKRFCHPELGDLTLTYNVFEVTTAPGLSLVGYTAEPDTPSAQAMSIMASWTTTLPRAAGARGV